MEGNTESPQVFISYSWSTAAHEAWVINLAERLMADGIIVVIDKWDLREGQDKYKFIEKMVNDGMIKRVLLICDKKYKEKADSRTKGVGEEALIISKELYKEASQNKFIPIIKEKNETNEPYLPTFISSRIYIDLSNGDKFEGEYEKLIRNIYGKPQYKRPALGTPPHYVKNEKSEVVPTSPLTQQAKVITYQTNPDVKGLVSSYLEKFLENLETYRVQRMPGKDFDEIVVESIDKLTSLRDDFVDFVKNVFISSSSIDLDSFKNFFEKLVRFQFRKEGLPNASDREQDNFKFLIYELVLYFFATLIEQRKYKEAAYFINATYFYKDSENSELRNHNIALFNRYVASLDEDRNRRLKLNRVSITADKVKERASRQDYPFSIIQEVDLILYYLTQINYPRDIYSNWYPRTAVYRKYGGIEIFTRLVSKAEFEKIKYLFNTNTIREFKEKIEAAQNDPNRDRRFGGFYYSVTDLSEIIDTSIVGTKG